MGESIIDQAMFNRQTVLLADDNDDDVLIMQNVFRKACVPNPLQVVGDGEQAISYLKGEHVYGDRERFPIPILVLLDVNMPKKNGLEVLQWLRAEPALKRLTVHILTASNRTVDVENAFELGANAYFVKPSKVQALVEMVRSWHCLAQFQAFPGIR